MKSYIVDSCFWCGLLDDTDMYYDVSNDIYNRLKTIRQFLPHVWLLSHKNLETLTKVWSGLQVFREIEKYSFFSFQHFCEIPTNVMLVLQDFREIVTNVMLGFQDFRETLTKVWVGLQVFREIKKKVFLGLQEFREMKMEPFFLFPKC